MFQISIQMPSQTPTVMQVDPTAHYTTILTIELQDPETGYVEKREVGLFKMGRHRDKIVLGDP